MRDKPVVIERFIIRTETVFVVNDAENRFQQVSHVVNIADFAAELGIDKVQRDKRCLIIRELHAGLLLDDLIRLETHAEFVLVQLPDVPQQRIGQYNALLIAIDGRRDMIGQRNVNAVRQLLAERDLRMVDNAFAHQEMRQRNACYQLLEPVGKLIRVQREPLFHLVRRCFVTCAAAEAQTAPHKHSLRTVFIQRDHNIVVEYLFYFHVRAS